MNMVTHTHKKSPSRVTNSNIFSLSLLSCLSSRFLLCRLPNHVLSFRLATLLAIWAYTGQAYMEDHLKNKDRLGREWEALCAYEAEPCSHTVASLPTNAKKNRYQDVLPYDHSRVILADLGIGGDYINASTIVSDLKMYLLFLDHLLAATYNYRFDKLSSLISEPVKSVHFLTVCWTSSDKHMCVCVLIYLSDGSWSPKSGLHCRTRSTDTNRGRLLAGTVTQGKANETWHRCAQISIISCHVSVSRNLINLSTVWPNNWMRTFSLVAVSLTHSLSIPFALLSDDLESRKRDNCHVNATDGERCLHVHQILAWRGLRGVPELWSASRLWTHLVRRLSSA